VRRNAAVRGNRRPAVMVDGAASAPASPAEAMELITQLEAEMRSAAADLRYEEAALLRDEIAEIRSSIPG
jgi:excinuclease UvrABC helicase subunit UvrB